jgi:general secretion pathway protein K
MRRTRRRPVSERGIALVAVSLAIVFIAAVTSEFTYRTSIDYQAAANARDEMRAHFLAASATNLSRLVIKVQKDVFDKMRNSPMLGGMLGDIQLADYLPMIVGAFGGSKDEVEALTAAIGGIDTSAVTGLGLPEGQFDLKVSTDDGKINVNCASKSSTAGNLALMLTALVASPAYDRVFEERDGDGQFTDRPTFVRAILDFVDADEAAYGQNGQAEDYGYESRSPAYRARDALLDSVEELVLVRGMDDRRWELFGPAFTVYGGCQVNVSAANDLVVILALIIQAAKDEKDPVLADVQKLLALGVRVAQARGLGVPFVKLEDFIKFVKDPNPSVGPDDPKGGGSAQPLLPPVEGIELDMNKLKTIARADGRRTYRIEATAKIGRVEKTIVAVWDTKNPNQNQRDVTDPAQKFGAWVYWRED